MKLTDPTPLWLDVPDEELSAMAFLYESGLETRITIGEVLDLFLALRQAREAARGEEER